MGEAARTSFRGGSASWSESSRGSARLGEFERWMGGICASATMVSRGANALGLVCLAGEMMGWKVVGSNPLPIKRLAKTDSAGSSG